MLASINTFLDTLPDWLHILFISAIPIIELRGALPYGVLILKMPYIRTILFCILGNMIPAPVILFLGKRILEAMMNSDVKFFSKIGTFVHDRSMKRSEKIEKYTYLGLMVFIGIPLPGTGVWTGCVVAAMLGLSPVKSMFAALGGTMLASLIVSLLVRGGVMLL